MKHYCKSCGQFSVKPVGLTGHNLCKHPDHFCLNGEEYTSCCSFEKSTAEVIVKDTNPKLSCGIRKVPVHNIPTGPLLEIGLAFMEGHMKYGSHNYRAAGVRASTYYDAVMARHMPVWWEGENIDAESGLNHITKAIASLIVLRDSMLMGNWVDDRPIRYPDGLDIAGFNKKASDLIDKYPEPKEPYLETDNKGE